MHFSPAQYSTPRQHYLKILKVLKILASNTFTTTMKTSTSFVLAAVAAASMTTAAPTQTRDTVSCTKKYEGNLHIVRLTGGCEYVQRREARGRSLCL